MGNGLHIQRVAALGDDPHSQVVPVVRKVHRDKDIATADRLDGHMGNTR